MRKHLHALALAISVFTVQSLSAQQEARKWYFGTNAGLDFATSPPTVLTNGALNTQEGCASICTANGNLLFYTDGMTVYNSNHVAMPNGTGLMGDQSTTQSGIIVKQPGNNSNYYVFTLAALNATPGLRYSVVDMSLAAGLGSVTVKNVPLYTPSTEKMVAVKHCNGVDTWVITHDHPTDVFRTYLVTSAGVSASPVLSALGPTMTVGYTAAGQMKVSPNGKKLGFVVTNFTPSVGVVYTFDFDASTGVISNPLHLTGGINYYGCEFSPDGTKFYVAELNSAGNSNLLQWDLCAGNNAAVISSSVLIASPPLSLGSMQLAPDKKIYISALSTQQLAVINNPNALGGACNFVAMGISTAPKTVNLGLPNFISSFFKTAPTLTSSINCTTASFTAAPVTPPNSGCSAANLPVSVNWQFGDPASAGSNTATGSNASHAFSGAGSYTVKCIYNYQCGSDTVNVPLTVNGVAPTLSISATRSVICTGEKTTLTASGATFYQWINGPTTTTAAVSPTSTTVYTLTGTDASQCEGKKQFTVTVNKCLGIGSNSPALEFGLFPNPVSSELKIVTNERSTITVYDQAGAVLYDAQVAPGENTLDVTFLEAGIYFVKLSSGPNFHYKRLIKTE